MADGVKIKINGMASLLRKIKKQPPALEVEMRDTMLDAATLVKDDVIRNIQGPKSGRFYTRSRIRYQASAAGEAPAYATGTLVHRIEVKKSNRAGKPQARIVAPGIYRLLENGTRTISPRPSFQAALARNEAKIEAMSLQRARKVFKQAGRG